MPKYIALLRGINVGGNTILPMSDLKFICTDIGLKNVRTYIQSGNLIFESELSEIKLKKKLEEALLVKRQKQIPVIIRTIQEMETAIAGNPFPGAEPSQTGVMFFAEPVPREISSSITTTGHEKTVISGREIYIHYPAGMGRSKLKFPKIFQEGTVRNINTINKLIRLGKGR